VRDIALDRNGNGVGWKWPLVKKDTRVFLENQINIINRLSIKRDESWVGLKFFCFTGASTFILMMLLFCHHIYCALTAHSPNCHMVEGSSTTAAGTERI
jgi:hypothetical protein